MLDIITEMYVCGIAARDIAQKLEQNGVQTPISKTRTISGIQMTAFCFRIPTTGPDTRFDAISISVAPGSQGFGRSAEQIIENPFPEIALIKNDELVYVDEIGYDDVVRFYEFEDLLAEVNRLISL